MNSTADPPTVAFNGTCSDPEAGPLLLGLLLSLVTVTTVVGNLLTVAAFATDRSLGNKPSTYLILSLSCADLLIGLAMPVRVGEAICSFWPFGEIGCELQVFFNDVAVVAGMTSMTVIALDRYLLISQEYPRYLTLQSRRNIFRTIALVWSMALGSALLEVIVWETVDWERVDNATFAFDEECLSPPRNNAIFALTIFVLVFLLPIVGVVGLSLRFLVLLRRRLQDFKTTPSAGRKESLGLSSTAQTRLNSESSPSKQAKMSDVSLSVSPEAASSGSGGEEAAKKDAPVVVGQPPPASQNSQADGQRPSIGRGQHTARDRYVRPAIIMGTLVTAFLVFSVPYLLFISVVVQLCPTCYHHSVQFHFVNVLFFNSCVNPFLYAATHPKIRKCHLNLLRSLKNKLTCR